MDISAALTTEEVAALSDPLCSFERAVKCLRDVRKSCGTTTGSTFEESLSLKNTLDCSEAQVRTDPSWAQLSILLNCEYQLYILNSATPLRYNPFLSHWVEAIQRLSHPLTGHGQANGRLHHIHISSVRAEMIKSLLRAGSSSQFSNASPRTLYETVVIHRETMPFDVEPYIQMLEEEGIYERKHSAKEGKQPTTNQSFEVSKGSTVDKPKLSDRELWDQNMLSRLESDPKSAISDLTHLPVELAHLDFLTTLLQERTLQQLSIEPSPIIREYIQHALRMAEQMGQPPGFVMVDSLTPSFVGESGVIDDNDIGIAHGRAAQIRAVKLLLLFIRNLIRKALLPPEDIYYEIQEICVRYVWIKEVREFRNFIEEGTSDEQASA
ncbi:uncharacterized protein BDR25DRAFT_287657 [Lindgomyces ingoldianus]|uniref:Uncharacterized protein n=1 Tax=Lindgomyces ingoldianus TaxID=673940 RepID=A0ACB6QSP6_9PLEO|nr:uncharacterized protein BDR25DRAFT_287657 [Lindgomyces ingoldianus]KAF2470044.1 hypothetical protein BDR25DRAFT_287657 [Lindgomyces ingoldianus]